VLPVVDVPENKAGSDGRRYIGQEGNRLIGLLSLFHLKKKSSYQQPEADLKRDRHEHDGQSVQEGFKKQRILGPETNIVSYPDEGFLTDP
jgi:hypothetical protein